MNILSLIVFFAFLVNLALGIYVYRLDSRSKLNRTFFIVCIDFAVWAFAYTFFYSAPDKESAWFWYRVSSVGWAFFPALSFYFFLILTEHEDILKKWWIWPVLLFPCAFVYKTLTGTLLVEDFVYQGLGWSEIAPSDSPWFWSYTIYYIVTIATELILTYRWGARAGSARKKKQARVIIFTALPTLIVSAITDTVFPALHVYGIPSVASILILGWIFGIWYSIVRYKLMILTPSIAIEDIVSRMSDMLLLVNQEGEVIQLNPRAKELLGYPERDLVGRQLHTLFEEREYVRNTVEKIRHTLNHSVSRELQLRSRDQGLIPMHVSCSAIRDREDDLIGIAVVGQDLRQMKQLRTEIGERKRAEERLQQMAFFDSLTGLPNRTLFFDRLSQTIAISRRNNASFAILFLDLDGFKDVNDTHGHDQGDAVLREVAQRLCSCARESDTVARMGGDEFAVILADISDHSEARNAADRIISCLHKPFACRESECSVGSSIGISIFPSDGEDIDTLLKKADVAMYSVKNRGKNMYSFYKG